MNEFVLRIATAVLVLSFVAWAALSLTVVLGRVWYDLWHRESWSTLPARRARRLVRRAGRRTRTDWGRWRRVAALSRLARAHHPATRRLLRRAIDDADPSVAAAAARSLGDLGDEWAIELLLDALRKGHISRSRVASQLERLAPLPGALLLQLVYDPEPAVRFWGATLLEPYPDVGQASLVALTRDSDANVRAAAVETLGDRGGEGAATATLALLDDSEWFVRVHAARAVGQVLGAAGASTITHLLADKQWWVRTAAKDALRGLGSEAVPSLLSVLTHSDPFARNGAAEVLQDIGFVDFLATDSPRSPLLERIYEAGGERLRQAAELRAESERAARKARAA